MGGLTLLRRPRYHRGMIAAVEGTLTEVEDGIALVRVEGGLTYEVLVPAHTAGRLAERVGGTVALHTRSFIEGGTGGSTMVPRLAGFETPQDRRFFDLFTTCRGIGQRKALRAMAMPTEKIVGAIADRDVNLLKSLPEIGRRTAEAVVTALQDRVSELAAETSAPSAGTSEAHGDLAREALEVLLQLGENRAEAVERIDAALREETPPDTVEQLLERVYRLKAAGG
jgi:Holliday junction DNA helicase RuvA